MGTPASVTCDLPQNQIVKSCTRKRASANIFQGVGLLQLRRLFRSSGDMQAEERAQLIWERAESHCITRALQQLHRRQRKLKLQANGRPPSGKGSSSRLLELQHFSHLRYDFEICLYCFLILLRLLVLEARICRLYPLPQQLQLLSTKSMNIFLFWFTVN